MEATSNIRQTDAPLQDNAEKPEEVHSIEKPDEDTASAKDQVPLVAEKNADEAETPETTVPPNTPASDLSFGNHLHSLPPKFPHKLKGLPVAYVREVGVRSCLDQLSGYFSCQNYRSNPIQFWFLDVIADCLWRLQDEFCFPEKYQRIILEWILYFFDLMRAPEANFCRQKFLKVFMEAIVLAEEHIKDGCEILPSPSDLLLFEDTESEASSTDLSTSSEGSSASAPSYRQSALVLEGEDENVVEGEEVHTVKRMDIFRFPEQGCVYFDSFVSSDEDFSSASPQNDEEYNINIETEEALEEEASYESDVQFYQPDLRTHSRFISTSSSSSSASKVDGNAGGLEEEDLNRIANVTWEKCPSTTPQQSPCPSTDFETSQKNGDGQNELKGEPEAGKENLDDSFGGPSSEDIRNKLLKYIEINKETMKQDQRNAFINCCASFAIKQFVFDYFHESLQFALIKLAFTSGQSVISQKINTSWNVPKIIRGELKRPKAKKEKKPKKGKKPKKASKQKGKKKKGSSKSSKSSKKSKGKAKKEKKPKKEKLTKAEKAELARLKKEQQMLEEELRRQEENRRMLFPLKEAAGDDFFDGIFEGWVKPKPAGKGKKGKKGKKKKG